MDRPLSSLLHDFHPEWRALPWPADWDAVFDRSAPLVLEIGFGNGDFLVDQAERHPERNHVGIEIAWGSVSRLLRRLEDRGLTNVRVLSGDGVFLLERLFAPRTLAAVFLNHSDPWPKERHHGRRVVQPRFLERVAERLVPGGDLTIATDHAEYADWIAERLEAQDRLVSRTGSTRVHEVPDRRTTRYEAKARAAGLPIHFFLYRLPEDAPPLPASPTETPVMPHVVLEGPLPDSALPAETVHTGTHQDVNVVTKFVGEYHREDGARLLDVIVKEGEFQQHFGILVAPHEDGTMVIKLAPLGLPRPTWGVKRAIRTVAEGVLGRGDHRLVKSTVGEPVPADD